MDGEHWIDWVKEGESLACSVLFVIDEPETVGMTKYGYHCYIRTCCICF